MSKQLGHIKAMSIMFEDNMKIEKMDYQSICFFVGKNGSGKTFVMKNIWCVNMLCNYISIKLQSTEGAIDLIKEAQFVYDHTFDDCDFTGYAEGFFEECEVRIEFDKGKVTKVDHNFPDDLMIVSIPIYMSGQTRTFDTFIKYMNYKKALGIANGMATFTEEELAKLLSVHKLYDMLFFEMSFIKLNGKVISDELKKTLKEQYEIKSEFDQILVDTDACTMVNYNRDTKESTSLTRYSAGEQSLLNMLLAAG